MQDRTIERLAQFVEVALTQKAAGPRVTASGSSYDANRRQWASHDESTRIPAYHTKQNLASGVLASYSQELLIFNNELDPFNPAHNEPFWVRIHGPLNGETAERVSNSYTNRDDNQEQSACTMRLVGTIKVPAKHVPEDTVNNDYDR